MRGEGCVVSEGDEGIVRGDGKGVRDEGDRCQNVGGFGTERRDDAIWNLGWLWVME